MWKPSICQCHIGAMFANRHRKRNTSGRKYHLMTGRGVKNMSFLEDFRLGLNKNALALPFVSFRTALKMCRKLQDRFGQADGSAAKRR